MKVLICGLPGAGKTWFARRLVKYIDAEWFNADRIRSEFDDWDFSPEGRIRQAYRMSDLAAFVEYLGKPVVCDFVAPTDEIRGIFNADVIVWMNTIEHGRFEDTNRIFEQPTADLMVLNKPTEEEAEELCSTIKNLLYKY